MGLADGALALPRERRRPPLGDRRPPALRDPEPGVLLLGEDERRFPFLFRAGELSTSAEKASSRCFATASFSVSCADAFGAAAFEGDTSTKMSSRRGFVPFLQKGEQQPCEMGRELRC